MTVLAMTLPLVRRSAIHVPRRDIVVGAGDEMVLRVSLVESDRHDAAPVNPQRMFARIRMHVWQDAGPLNSRADYGLGWRGPLLTTRSAMATAQRPDSIDVTVGADTTFGWMGSGRLGWSLQAAVAGDEAALCWGALHMRPGLGMPPLHVLTGDGEKVLTADGQYVVI